MEVKELVINVEKYLNFMNFLLIQLIYVLNVGKQNIIKHCMIRGLEN